MQPDGEVRRGPRQFAVQVGQGQPSPLAHLAGVGLRQVVRDADEHVVVLVLDQLRGHRLPVEKGRHRLQRAPQAQLFVQPPQGGRAGVLAGAGMPAAAVAPQAGRVVLAQRALLQQHPALRVEQEDRERPVQDALAVGVHLLDRVQRPVFGVDGDQEFVHELLQK
ncbi:hypothetical protein FQZ97_710040 [compost metagenome]